MDGIDVARANDENRTYLILRAQTVVNAFLASELDSYELTQKEFEAVLAGANEVVPR